MQVPTEQSALTTARIAVRGFNSLEYDFTAHK
jgi:hypothetical protein